MAQWGLDALLTGLAGRPVTAAQLRGDFRDLIAPQPVLPGRLLGCAVTVRCSVACRG